MNTIVINYSGDEELKKFLFLGQSNIIEKSDCKSSKCINVKVDKNSIILSSKYGKDVYVKTEKFSKENQSIIQKADLLRLKIILFNTNISLKHKEVDEKRKERFKKKTENPLTPKLIQELENKLKPKLADYIDKSIESSERISDIKLDVLKKEIQKSEKSSDVKLDILKKETQKDIEVLEKKLLNKLNSLQKKEKLYKNQFTLGVSKFFNYDFANNYSGLFTSIKTYKKNIFVSLSSTYLKEEWKDRNFLITSKYMIINTDIGVNFNLYKKLSLDLSSGIFLSLINNNIENNSSFTDISSGISFSYNFNWLLTDYMGVFVRNDILFYFSGYDNRKATITDNLNTYDITLHETSIASIMFTLGFTISF